MNSNWKTVRVFISSTFRDMQAERDHLVRFVFPRLREQLLPRRIHLVDVDLRWGVTSEEDASEVCREIINECRPRFLCMLGGRYGTIPEGNELSITADEVHYGVLDQSLKDRGFAYFYFRDDADTTAMVETTPGEFREPQGSDNQNKLAELKQAIIAAGLNPFAYPAQWDNESRRLTGLNKFGDRVHDDLLDSVKSDPELRDRFVTDTAAQFDEENAAMEAFVEERSERFVLGSREAALEELLAHTNATGGNGYVCLTGAPGSGKSALLAHLSRHSTLNSQLSTLLISHFVGASPGSTDVRRTLRRLCHELKAGCPDITADIPDDPEKLRVAFPDFLRQACARQRVVILLDAVNQFDPASHSAGLHWLPEELPANARVILSALDGPALEELRRRSHKPRENELKPLTAEDGEAIIEQFRKRYRKKFEPDQRAALLAKTDAGTPLYLLAALEELRTLGAYEEITRRIAELPPTTNELFAWILERLENDDGFRDASARRVGRELVSCFAALLGASRYGLSQHELTDLLDAGDPQGNVAALLHLLRPYLMRRGELFDFYHGQFRAAAGEAWLKTDEQCRAAHAELAGYFHNQDNFLEPLDEQRGRARRMPPTPRPANHRKVEELVYQRLNTLRATPTATSEFDQACGELEDLLMDLFFLEAKTEAGMVFELACDFTEVVMALPEARDRRGILRLLEEALGRDIHFIARHTTTLFQCLWNSCWWHDCPESARHYEQPRTEVDQSTLPETSDSVLYLILQSWRAERRKDGAQLPWVRLLRLPPVQLTGERAVVFRGHVGALYDAEFLHDERRVITGGNDGTIRTWDSETGRLENTLSGHGAEVWHIRHVNDADLTLSCSRDGTVRRWCTDENAQGTILCKGSGQVFGIAINRRRGEFAFGGHGGILNVAEIATSSLRWSIGLATLSDLFADYISAIHYSPDDSLIALTANSAGNSGGFCFVFDAVDCSVLHQTKLGGTPCSLAWAADGGAVYIGGRTTPEIIRFDLKSGEKTGLMPGHRSGTECIAVSPDGGLLASGDHDGEVLVWDLEQSKLVSRILAHTDTVYGVRFSRNAHRLLSASADGTARLTPLLQMNTRELKRLPLTTRAFMKYSRGEALITTADGEWDSDEFTPSPSITSSSICGVSDDARMVAGISPEGDIEVFDRHYGKKVLNLSIPGEHAYSAAFCPTSPFSVAFGSCTSGNAMVRVLSLQSQEVIFQASLPGEGMVTCLAFSVDCKFLAVGTTVCRVTIWNLETRLPVWKGQCVPLSPAELFGNKVNQHTPLDTIRPVEIAFTRHLRQIVVQIDRPDRKASVQVWDVRSMRFGPFRRLIYNLWRAFRAPRPVPGTLLRWREGRTDVRIATEEPAYVALSNVIETPFFRKTTKYEEAWYDADAIAWLNAGFNAIALRPNQGGREWSAMDAIGHLYAFRIECDEGEHSQ